MKAIYVALITLSFLSSLAFGYETSEMTKESVITPTASPNVRTNPDFILSADFIYWTARLGNINFVHTNAHGSLGTSVVHNGKLSEGQNYRVSQTYSPGFKVGAGLTFERDGWDLFLEYTWFHTSPNTSISSFSENETATIKTPHHNPFSLENVEVASASQNYKLQFNNFDLALRRDFFISQKLTLRPHIGLKGTWFTQQLMNSYVFEDFFSEGDFSEYDDYHLKSQNRQSFWGVGIQIGLDTNWILAKGFSIFGNLSTSALWSQQNLRRRDNASLIAKESSLNNIEDFDTVRTSDSFHTLSPVIELLLGLRYDYLFSNSDLRFRLQAGWEEQVWFDQNQFLETRSQASGYGNLAFQGLNIKLRFDF